MSAVRYYLDEHIAEAVGTGLRNRGIDVLTLSEAGMLGASDREHLSYAYEEGRVLVTYDDDFFRLAHQTKSTRALPLHHRADRSENWFVDLR